MKSCRQYGWPIFALVIVLMGVFGLGSYCHSSVSGQQRDVIQVVANRNLLERQARECVRKGKLDEAIALYEEALHPKNINYDYEGSTARGALRAIYKWKGEYDKALLNINEIIIRVPSSQPALIERQEIEALLNYQSTQKLDSVLSHIYLLQKKEKEILPPFGYGLGATSVISKILRLYDTIGDHDAGIAFIDEILDYFYKKHPDMPRVVNSSEAATKADNRNQASKDPNWRGYRIIREYHLVREAFELDKKEGTKGRATKALIQSDYFPW